MPRDDRVFGLTIAFFFQLVSWILLKCWLVGLTECAHLPISGAWTRLHVPRYMWISDLSMMTDMADQPLSSSTSSERMENGDWLVR
ncbi:hypothetical protein I7I48_09471 [Histoplasma ohiense]|nr:hypothetical protein I7I48_09471 [Histoplasma ohiense (nom. inval.)]